MPLRILISSPANGSGKTSLLVGILRRFPGRFSAAKFITIEPEGSGFCPIHETGCACRRMDGPWGIVTDSAILSQKDTDTGRMVAWGARETVWALARPGHHAAMWDDFAANHLDRLGDLLVEGGRIEAYVPVDLRFFVLDPTLPRSRWKDDLESLVARADLVILNRRADEIHFDTEQIDWVHRHATGPVRAADLAEPLEDGLLEPLL
jgi:hypothetical protein